MGKRKAGKHLKDKIRKDNNDKATMTCFETRAIIHFFIGIYFTRITRLKSAKFYEYFKNKTKAEILKRI